VIDGDTIEVEFEDGTPATVRYIGIDTPETVAPGRPVDCFGREASDRNKELVEGKLVYLERDVSQTDRFGRLLRYVYLEDGTFVNDLLVWDGYARVATFPPDVRHTDRFLASERSAREAGVGLWGACPASPAPADPPPASPPAPPATGSGRTAPISVSDCPASHPIKGNVSSSGELIYHVPGGQFYSRTNPEECFATEADAQAAGYRRSQR
jgi:micrococcal nuclease